MEFNNTVFNIVEMEKEILRNSQVMIDKENMEISIKNEQEIFVEADEFYIDQVLTNYITNAIKYAIPINGIKRIEIFNEIDIKREKVIVRVFNTYENFTEEEMIRIWNRFYKKDESRNRERGGNGIGLSLVKAIMNNYENEFGVENKAGGVEFYFELNLKNN